MKAAKLVKVEDSVCRGVNGLPGTEPNSKADTYLSPSTSTSGLNAGMQGPQNRAVTPVSVKKVDFKDLRTGEDFRYPQKDTAEPSLEKISHDTIRSSK